MTAKPDVAPPPSSDKPLDLFGYASEAEIFAAFDRRKAAKRATLRRVVVPALLGLLSLPSFAAAKAPRHVTKSLSAISVKVVLHEDYARGQKARLTPWRITGSRRRLL